jgi:signal peptidase II
MHNGKRWFVLLCLVACVVGLDQASKWYIHTTFALHESYPVWEDFFAITYVRNPGAAFGFLARHNKAFLQFFFPIVTLAAVVALVYYFSRMPRHHVLTQHGIGLIIGGALGNGIDRLWLGQVIDFIDVHWYAYHWPAFNVADSAICTGVGLLLLEAFRTSGHTTYVGVGTED